MASTSETGHAKNVANFDALITHVRGYGLAYNPSNTSLTLTALIALSASAKNTLNNCNTALAAYKIAASERIVVFKPLNTHITRVFNAVKATGTSQETDDNVKSVVRKIKGGRATPKKSEEEKQNMANEGKEIREISSSQMSFDSRLDNLDKLIKLLASITQYSPNEADLKITSLTDLYNKLYAKNNEVINASIALSNARIRRNELLYKLNSGLVDTALDVKSYIKSLYGITGPQYKQIAGIKFKSEKV
jgi:hypothetical protein